MENENNTQYSGYNSKSDLRSLVNNLHLLILPSTLWAIHVDPQYDFIAVLHINLVNYTKLIIDKGILITCFESSSFIHNEIVKIPALNLNVKVISDLSQLVYSFDDLKLCPNYNEIKSLRCEKYVKHDLHEYCNMCFQDLKTDVNIFDQEENSFNSAYDQIIDIQNSFKTQNNFIQDDTIIFINKNTAPNTESNKLKETVKPECSECHQKFSNVNYLKIHKRKHSGYRPFSCEYCGKSFIAKSHLTEHIRLHTGEKQFCCTICNKRSTHRSAHQRHLLTHTNIKPNLCNVCGKTFSQGYRMEDHLLTHSNDKAFECTLCRKRFAKSYNLKLHQKTHTGARPYICSICGKTYTTQSNLSTHVMSTHSSKKPYSCSTCDMSFVHPHLLKLHVRKHTGERPYKCTVCKKAFAKNIHLTVHNRTHTGEKPYLCKICGKGFTTTGNMNSHQRVHHKDLPTVDI